MKHIGEKLRELRESKGLLLREVGASLSIDPTLLSKIERGDRIATKNQITDLSKYYNQNEDLIIEWLSDKVAYDLSDEKFALEAIKVAEQKILYKSKK